jgi:ankyrin repeat protein
LLAAGAKLDVVAAAMLGRHEVLEQILRTDPAQANDRTTNMTPLAWCGYGWQAESARILLRHGAIIDRQPFSYDARHPVAQVGATAVLRVLLEHGADPNWQHDTGDTMLHWVIRSRMVQRPLEFLRVLIEAGAVPLPNAAGLTPLDEAIAQRDKPVEQYFPAKEIGRKEMSEVIELLQRDR